jgi:hypothetical protein
MTASESVDIVACMMLLATGFLWLIVMAHSLRSRCKHEWNLGVHPVTLQPVRRICSQCGRSEKPSLVWKRRLR